MPQLYKIGFTTETVEHRIQDLSRSTGVPEPFECLAAIRVPHAKIVEEKIHTALSEFKVNKEFFRMTDNLVKSIFTLVCLLTGGQETTEYATGSDKNVGFVPMQPIAFPEADAAMTHEAAKPSAESSTHPVSSSTHPVSSMSNLIKPGTAWRPEEDVLIERLFIEGMTMQEISECSRRTENSIIWRLLTIDEESKYLTPLEKSFLESKKKDRKQ